MYLEYLKEREDMHIIQIHEGFLLYKLLDGELLISDIYVLPQYRKKGISAVLADKAKEIARANGYKHMTCQADLAANGCEAAVKTILSYGFKLLAAGDNKISFYMGV